MGKNKSGKKQKAVTELSIFEYDRNGVLLTPELPFVEDLKGPTPAVAIDCEMVGVGRDRKKKSTLARVSIVNEHGFCLYDSFVKPHVPVMDYRTKITGIKEKHLNEAPPFGVVVKKVRALLEGRILVGHGLEHDLTALGLEAWFPLHNCRDTGVYFVREIEGWKPKAPALRDLVRQFLGPSIQDGVHSSIIDAQAVMALYQQKKTDWESRQETDVAKRDRWFLEGRIFEVQDERKFLVAPLSYRSSDFWMWERE